MNVRTKSVSILILAVFLTLALPMQASAATEAEIQQSIEQGTAWLAANQNPDGSWGYYPWGGLYPAVGITGLAVLKLETHATDMGMSPLDPAYIYQPQVKKGLEFLFSKACVTNNSMVYFANGSSWQPGCSDTYERTYQASIAMMAIAASKEPTEIVNVSGSPVNGWTYQQVLEGSMDYLAAGQMISGNNTGGWGYSDRMTMQSWDRSDNSNSGWATLALGYMSTSPFNIPIPGDVLTNLSIWIDYIQTDNNTMWCDNIGSGDCIGGSGYSQPNSWVNILKTGHLLYEMALVGDTATTPRVINATDYIDRHFNDNSQDPGWRVMYSGNASNASSQSSYHATYTAMKGLESLGIETLPNGTDWYDDFSTAIVNEQNQSGSWGGCQWGYWGDTLCTTWALLTLEKAVPIPPATGVGKVTGGGWIVSPVTKNNGNGAVKGKGVKNGNGVKTGQVTFGLVAKYHDGSNAPKGNLQYVDHVTGMVVHGNVESLAVDKTTMTATFSGTAFVNGMDGYAYTVTVVDNGEPGNMDTLSIDIPAKSYTASGTLEGGNIQIHKK